jgi:ribonuclease-3
MHPYDELKQNIEKIEKIIGYTFSEKELLLAAFTHSSFLNENKDLALSHNERLEFLGDSVLNLLVGDWLYRNHPDLAEGELSALRSSCVSAHTCAQFVKALGLDRFLLKGKGEQLSMSKRTLSLDADLFEALLGAIFLDGGLEKAGLFFFSHFHSLLQDKVDRPERNFKAALQELLQKKRHEIPQYRVLEEIGPDHEKNFKVGVWIGERLAGSGSGASKKEAEQNAAQEALRTLKEHELI